MPSKVLQLRSSVLPAALQYMLTSMSARKAGSTTYFGGLLNKCIKAAVKKPTPVNAADCSREKHMVDLRD